MPSVAQEAFEGDGRASGGSAHGLPIFTKKRRWEDARSSSGTGGTSGSHGGNDVVAILMHGGNDRTDRADHNNIHNNYHSLGHDRNTMTTATATFTLNASFSPQRKILPLASKRVRLSSSDHDDSNLRLSPSSKSAARDERGHPPPSSFSITPCHICHRRPRRKCDLDSLADCEGCGQRTCFVCLRECLGWAEGQTPTVEDGDELLRHEWQRRHDSHNSHSSISQPWSPASPGHRRMVCSRCCVERGEDGDVVCLGCVAFAGK